MLVYSQSLLQLIDDAEPCSNRGPFRSEWLGNSTALFRRSRGGSPTVAFSSGSPPLHPNIF